MQARDVSRETLARLEVLEGLIRKWTPAINLVAKSTVPEIWFRHILDSAQIFDLRPKDARRWVDLGSGGGFPGLVIAALAASEEPQLQVTLVESDARKAAFLSTALREMGLAASVCCARAEDLAPLGADVVSARAVAPLDKLLGFAARHLAPGGRALFPKGARHRIELDAALAHWRFDVQESPSLTDSSGVILSIGELQRV